MAGDHAVPAQHPHIAKGPAATNRDGLSGADRHLHPAVGQRIPDAVKHLLRDAQLDVGKVAVKVEDHLPGTLRAHDVIHGNRKVAAPAVGNLLALLARDLHFFDNRAPFFKKPHPGRGQFYVAMTALKEGHRQPLFQLTHRIADGRGYAVQLLGRCTKAAITGDGVHHFKGIFRPHFLPAKFLNATAKY